MGIIEFIKEYYKIILLIVVAIIILILSLSVILKKDDKEKKESTLSLSKEKKSHNSIYKDTAIIFRESTQDYIIRFFDQKGKNFLISKLVSSKIGSNSLYNKIINSISNDEIVYSKTLDNKYRFYIYNDSDLIAYSIGYDSKEEINHTIDYLKTFNLDSLMDEQIKREAITLYSSTVEINKKMNKKAFDSETVLDTYKVIIKSDNLTLLESIPSRNKKDNKKMHDALYKELNKKTFKIINDLDNKYYFILETFTGNILSIGEYKSSKEEVINEIDKILTII